MSAFDPAPLDGVSQQPRVWKRFVVFALAVVLVVGVLAYRMWDLQVHQADRYASMAVKQRVATVPVPVPRGLMYDRKGRLLVENVPMFVVDVRPADLPFTQRDRVVDRLSDLLKIKKADLFAELDKAAGDQFQLIRLAENVPTAVARVISEEHLTLPGVIVDTESRRHYLYGPLVSLMLGWTGKISGEDYRRLRSDGYLVDEHDREGGPGAHLRGLAARYLRPQRGPEGRRRPHHP